MKSRRLFASILLSLILFSSMKNGALISLYAMDKAAFIEAFCVNKDKPRLKCNGQCKIAKMRADEEEKKAKDLLSFIEHEIFQLYTQETISPMLPLSTQLNGEPSNTAYINYYSFLFAIDQHKPPQGLVHIV